MGVEETTFSMDNDTEYDVRLEVLRKVRSFGAHTSRAASICSWSSSMNNNMQMPGYNNANLKEELLQKNESRIFQEIFQTRKGLTAVQQCRDILRAIRAHQVVMVVGRSGCGKTTQIPQMILDDFIFNNCGTDCRIACIETRATRAVSAAERVAYERLESVGNSIGLEIEGQSIMPRHTGHILFCTAHILTKKFESDPLLQSVTVVILDDIQTQNSEELHRLMDLLQTILPHRADLKIILLSTTASEDSFCDYFKDYHAMFIHETIQPKLSTASSMSTIPEIIQDTESIITISDGDSTIMENNYRKSMNILRRYEGKDASVLSRKEKNLIRTHKRNVKRLERMSGLKSSPKMNTTPGMRIKTRQNSMDICNDLQVAIIDKSDLHGRLDDNLWMKLEERLLSDMISSKWCNEEISFDGANWSRGVKIVKCGNHRSIDFLRDTVASVCERWPHLQLEVIPQSMLPLRVLAKMWIPPPVPPTNAILSLIEKQNAGIDTKDWKILNYIPCKNNFGQIYRLYIDGLSAKVIHECQGRIKFGLNFIRIHTMLKK
uniref:Helicase ATP-binding domain-containing protein n=1 Tax=Stomoxys calcitrans TaxID=35570 RepID=A0A1I8NLR0_STOCA